MPLSVTAPVVYGKLEHPWLYTVFAALRDGKLVRISFDLPEDEFRLELENRFRSPAAFRPDAAAEALDQIRTYLNGDRTVFDLPLDISSLTAFRQRALRETLKIPYGQTATYGEIARRIGSPRAARAVGRAMAANPIPLVIPCHRVLAADGALTGYSGGRDGLAIKSRLLELEAAGRL